MKTTKAILRTVVATSAMVFATIAAHATTIHLKSQLKGSSEVPAQDVAGTGTLTGTLDSETNEFSYHVEFSGLTGPVVAAHFHGPAAEGAKAKPQLPVDTSSADSSLSGKATLTAEQAKDLADGKWYFNLHTSAHPGGEIRGQVVKSE